MLEINKMYKNKSHIYFIYKITDRYISYFVARADDSDIKWSILTASGKMLSDEAKEVYDVDSKYIKSLIVYIFSLEGFNFR